MRRTPRPLRTIAAAFVAALLVPAIATAASDSARERLRDAARDVEAIELDCSAGVTDHGAAVRCEWSKPTWPVAHALRLYRFDPATDRHRQVVFRTVDLDRVAFTDTSVRAGHRYAYAVAVVDARGRVVGRSRAEWVRVPSPDRHDVEVLRLDCALGRQSIGCEWSRPQSRDAALVTLWRSVDEGPRELVETFRPAGPNAYRDRVPEGATRVVYVVIASSDTDRVVGRSRPEVVRIPAVRDRPVTDRPVTDRPVTDRPTDRPAVRPTDPIVAPTPATTATASTTSTTTTSVPERDVTDSRPTRDDALVTTTSTTAPVRDRPREVRTP